MTFRPADDVLDSIENPQQPIEASNQYNQPSDESASNDLNGWNWSRVFSNPNDENDEWNIQANTDNVWKPAVEEVKAPDLSELLEKSEESANSENAEFDDNVEQKEEDDFTVDLSEIENNKWKESLDSGVVEQENSASENNWWSGQEEELVPGKMPDKEREEIISWIEWSVHSKLDFLVDNERKSVVEIYRKIYRILFKWWEFIFVVVLGVLWWIIVQAKSNHSGEVQLIGDNSIQNIGDWKESNVDKILSNSTSKEKDIETIISYWSVSVNNKWFQSKSNLIKYDGVVLPQLVSIDFSSTGFISLDKFQNHETTREDMESMVDILIMNDANYRRTSSLMNVTDLRWEWQVFEWWFFDGFWVWCVKNDKFTDFVCDKFLGNFYEYGKYYDLSLYSSDLLILVRELSRQGKDVQPICDMIPEYIWHSWDISSDILGSVMNFCPDDDRVYYRKIVNFIDIENSLKQPELLDKVFDNPDLNAYKLLSAQQIVYRWLNGSSINENFIKSYLTYVQNLLNKDRGTGRYLEPVYKDMLYIFNTDILYRALIQKGSLTSELTSQIEQINNWNRMLDYLSLTSQLTTPDIVKSSWQFITDDTQESTLEEVFSKFYNKTDRLKIRRKVELSDTDLQVQTEIYSDAIFRVTWGETLKATVLLQKRQNVLYVESINISNQRGLSDTLNIHASDWDVSFDAMLWYIDEQIWFWYKAPWEKSKVETNLCDKLDKRWDVEVYNCDESSIILYKWDVEYTFTLLNWILESFAISDPDIETRMKEMLSSIMTSRDNTPTIIESIIDFELETSNEKNIEKKLEAIDQFRIHFKLVPTISDIEWEDDVFMVEFSIWDFDLSARYNVDTHLLTKISYVACEKTLEIRNLTIEVSTSNEIQLTEILNNPRTFFANANSAAYRKYQRMCE